MTRDPADRACDGDISTVRALLKVMERREKMLGLDHTTALTLTNNGQVQVIFDGDVVEKKRSAVEVEVEPDT